MSAIVAQHLTKVFHGVRAVDDLSFTIESGEIVGYLGPNGAGKSTTIKLLTGMIRPTAGSASLGGHPIDGDVAALRRLIGLVPETGALYEKLSAREYLDLVGGLHRLPPAGLRRKAGQLLDLFGLGAVADAQIAGYSKGMRQKVAIIGAVLHDPPVLFLDEPLSGLDANAALLVKELVRDLARAGRTVFFCSHVLEVVAGICDRVIIVAGGRIVAQGRVDDLQRMARAPSLEAVFSALTTTEDMASVGRSISAVVQRPDA